MYGAFILLIILVVQTDGFTLGDVQCNHIFRQECHADINNYNVVRYNSSIINYCTTEDVPNEIDFTVIWDENDEYLLKVEFTPPKRECRYGVALLVNPSIKDERECREYKFEKANDINSTVHTREKTLCVVANNQLVRYNDNSTVSLCKGNIEQWYQYIFTGCYALRFHIGRQNYLIRGHKLLNTTYHPKEVMEPQFICKYNIHSNFDERHELTNFTLNTSLPSDTGLLLKVGLISEHNKSLEDPCVWHGEPPIYTRTISLMKKASRDHNCTRKWMQTARGERIKTVQCNFQVQTKQFANYCFVFRVTDDRCHKNTFWTPPNVNGMMPCTWIKRCARAFENSTYIENTDIIKSDKLLNANSYLLLPIIAVVLVVSTIVGTSCFFHYLRIRKEMNLYVNPQHDDFMNPVCLKPADFNIVDNNDSEKRIHHDHFTCDDIILMYTKNSTSFMALMKDFRETLAKICSCYVHDWHDGAEWNDVAKVGSVLWFTDLLNCGCRVVWIDTPATRSIIMSNSNKNDSNFNKLNKYYEIGDFRDVAFPVVLEFAKRNTKDVAHQYRRHFIVRFEELENTVNMHDPFLDLAPHARYCMPQHLVQLCSDISLIKPMIPKCQMKAEEDLLQQRLRFMKIESMM